MSALPFPQVLHPNPEAAGFGSESQLSQGIAATAHEILCSVREVNHFLAQLPGTFCGAIFGLTLSKHWQEGVIPGVICDLSSHWWFCLLRWGKGLFLMHTQVIMLKDALQVALRRFNSPSTYPSLRLYLNHHFAGEQFPERHRGLYKLSFYTKCIWV